MIYVALIVLAIMFIIYLYYQVKIKNNKNYPISLAMGLAFLVIASNGYIGWIIETFNKNSEYEIPIPYTLSIFEIAMFFILLYGLSALYYKYTFGEIFIQKNFIFSFFHFGNNEQNNRR